MQSLRAAFRGIAVTDTISCTSALQIPKGVSPFVPTLKAGLRNGSLELQGQSASGIGELIEFINSRRLRAVVMKFAGALIWVILGLFQW
ncbi:Protein ILITYHIA [Gracilariopsis chorda]|uniref:Protein ILITYHIA n=1 Tax=Gracilariopsis chorda TaxID=448386 RepID=A0A2V3IMV0_9FLOR|nr:Protein ILITYHIA [Gracilariopsis chorda]|eukprot:PXF43406.1 Protein ILITYHIA [Gracilariopsis chorda]